MSDAAQPTRSRHRRRRTSEHGERSRPDGGRRSSSVRRLLLRLAAATVFSAAIGWIMIQHYLADHAPSVELADAWWRSDGTTPLLAEARTALSATPAELNRARGAAQSALLIDPLNFSALSILAEVAEVEGDLAGAARLRRLVLDRTRRDLASDLWQLQQMVRQEDISGLIEAVDILLRISREPELSKTLMETLVGAAALPASAPPLIAALMEEPPWQRAFLTAVARDAPVDAFPRLAEGLNAGRDQTQELNPIWSLYLQRLINQGQGTEAYALWSGLLSETSLQELRPLYNGGFEAPFTGLPFDWLAVPLKGVAIIQDAELKASGSASVQIAFGGAPVQFQHLYQYLILQPGQYRLSGQARTESLATERGLRWRIYCVQDKKLQMMAETAPFSGTASWSPFEMSFEVAEAGCATQMLRLELPARIAAERQISGRAWFDDLNIDRVQQ